MKEQIISKINLCDFALKYLGLNIESKKMKCINPLHLDENPSMVYEDGGDKPNLHCWGCNKRWDVFDLASMYLEREGKANSFKDSVIMLAELAGIEIELEPNNRLEEYFELCKKEVDLMLSGDKHQQILQYLNKRGVRDESVIRKIGIAVPKMPFRSISEWYAPMQKEGAIAFPLTDHKGRIIGIKYRKAALNTSGEIDKFIRTVGSNDGFFGSNTRSKFPLLVESEIDCLILMQTIDCVISFSGAESSMREIASLNADVYTFIPHNDDPDPSTGMVIGHKPMVKLASLGAKVLVSPLPPEYKDADEFVAAGNDINKHIEDNHVSLGSFMAKWRFDVAANDTNGARYDSMTRSIYSSFVRVDDRHSFKKVGSKILGVSMSEIESFIEATTEVKVTKLREEVQELMELPDSSSLIAELCFKYYSDNGGIWLRTDREVFLVLNGEKMRVQPGLNESNARFHSILYRDTGLNSAEKLPNYIINAIRLIAMDMSHKMDNKGHTHFDYGSKTLYVATNENSYLKINKDGYEECKNGESGLYFYWPEHYKRFEFDPDVNKKAVVKFMKEELLDRLACEKYLRPMIFGFFIASYFRSCVHGQRAILHIGGGQGAGKTSAMSQFGLLMFGDDLNRGRATQAAIVSSASIEPLMLLDNWEVSDLTQERKQFLLTSVTGGSSIKRTMNTERGVTVEVPDAMLVITSIEDWGNPELKSRMLSIEFDKKYREGAAMVTLAELRNRIESNREWVLSGLIKIMMEDLMPKFHDGTWETAQSYWLKMPSEKSLDKDRILPTVALISLIASTFYNIDNDFCDNPRQLFRQWQNYIFELDRVDKISSNPFIYYISALEILKSKQGEIELRYNKETDSWMGTMDSFISAFNMIDKTYGNKDGFPYKNARSAAKRASHAAPELKSLGYTFETFSIKNGINQWVAKAPPRE